MTDENAPTHIAYAMKREGKRRSRWLEIGQARQENDGEVIHVSLDRTPVGGFNGYVYLLPVGVKPPDIDSDPRRPIGEDDS